MIKKLGKTKVIVFLITLALVISLFSAYFVYADNDSYTVTINYDEDAFEVRQNTTGGGDPIQGEFLISQKDRDGGNGTIYLVDAVNQYTKIQNAVLDEENHQIRFTVTKGQGEESPRASKIFISNNVYHLFNMQNEEVNLNAAYSDDINSSTEYQIGVYSELGFSFQYEAYNPQDVDGIESINNAKDTITYKKNTGWDGEADKNLYDDVNVSLVKGTVENNVITVLETCKLEQKYYMNGEDKIYNEGNYRFNVNRMDFDGYYLKVDSKIYNDIALRYSLNNSQENYNICYTSIRDAEAETNDNYYVPLNTIAKNKKSARLDISGVESKYEDRKMTFQNVTAINDNKLTYKYNNKNVYVELIDSTWELNEQTHEWEEQERVNPLTLVENTDDCYEFNKYTNNGFNNYKLRLSFDEADREELEGNITFRINGTRARFDSKEDENNPGNWIDIPNRIVFYDYDGNITVSELVATIGDTPVEFKNAQYQGTAIEPTKRNQWEDVQYSLPNYNDVRVDIESKDDREEWHSVEFDGVNNLKIFSDEIQDGRYRISLEGNDCANLIINGVNKKDSMQQAQYTYWWTDKENPKQEDYEERQGTKNVYILTPEDIQNGKIEISISFSYKIRVKKDVILSNNNRTVAFITGADETSVKATFNSVGQFTLKQEEYDDHSIEEYYELEIQEEEITDKLISLDNNFNTETMEVAIRDWNDFILPTYEENDVRYVQLTNLKEKYTDEHGEEIEENYYFATDFDFDVRIQGSGVNHELPPPAAKVGYFTISEGEDPEAGGTVYYYFLKKVDGKYVYIDNNGAVLDGIQEAGSISEFQQGSAQIAYPTGAEYIEIKVSTKNRFTEATDIDLFINGERVRNLQVLDDNSNPIVLENEEYETCDLQDIVKAKNGRIPFKITELGENTMGMTIYFEYRPEGNLDIKEPGIYVNPRFSDDDMSASLMYKTNKNTTERTINYYTKPEEKVVILPQDISTFTLKANYSDLVDGAPEVHLDILDSNLEPIPDEEQDRIAARLTYDGMREDGETPNNYWDDFMDEFTKGNEATFDVTPLKIVENNYTVVLNVNFKGVRDEDNDKKAHVLSWSNDPNGPWGKDALIDGGKAYLKEAYKEEDGNLVKIYDRTVNGDVYHTDEMEEFRNSWARNEGKMYEFAVNQDNRGGEIEAVEGIKLVFEFVPNYGKQLVEVGLGRRDADVGASQRYYEFIMPAGHVHFSAKFKEVQNTTSGDYVESTEYTLPNNIEEIVGSGTLDLSLKDVSRNLTDEQKQAFANVGGEDYNVSKYLDVDLNQIWYKGKDDAEDVWSNPIYDLGNGNEVEVTIKVPEGINVKNVVILHEEHNGDTVTGYTKITPTSYNTETRTITFKTSKFSNFAIATNQQQSATPTEVNIDFKNISYQGVNIESSEYGTYRLPSNSYVKVQVQEQNKSGDWEDYSGTLYSDKIENGKYRILLNSTTKVIINNQKKNMEKISYGNVYVLTLDDIKNGKIDVGLYFLYKVRVDDSVIISNDNRTAEFKVGKKQIPVKMTFNSKGKFVYYSELAGHGEFDRYYELEFEDSELTDKLISVDKNYNPNTMGITTEEGYNFPVYEDNGTRYLKLTNLKINIDGKEEPFYFMTYMDFAIDENESEDNYETIVKTTPTVNLSKDKFTYNKKVQKPKVVVKDSKGNIVSSSDYDITYSNSNSKKIGEYKLTVTFKGDYYEGTKTLKYYIAPKVTSMSKVKAGKKLFTASWKKQTAETTGYEVQYSTNKNFASGNKTIDIKKNKVTSTTKKKLKGKTKYYVRVRTYKKVGKKKIYSDWSSIKAVTTKK